MLLKRGVIFVIIKLVYQPNQGKGRGREGKGEAIAKERGEGKGEMGALAAKRGFMVDMKQPQYFVKRYRLKKSI